MHDIDDWAAAQASRQYGLVSLAQLRERGAGDRLVRRRVAAGRWVEVDRGVYRLAGVPTSWEATVLGAVLAAGEGAVASHRSAAVLWGLDGCRAGAPEVTVPRGRRYRRPGVHTHESTDLGLVTPVPRLGIPATPVARTLLDLGAVASPGRVHLAVDDARRRRLTDWDALLAVLVAHARKGRNGVGALRSILDEHFGEVATTDSGFERLVVAFLRQAGLPAPVLQHEVEVAGRAYRLDLAYPEHRVAIELDGSVHLRRDVWEADRARQNALVLAGWTVLRFTWRDYLDHPERLATTIHRCLNAP
jgi:very-short-patch-repair endonuclease